MLFFYMVTLIVCRSVKLTCGDMSGEAPLEEGGGLSLLSIDPKDESNGTTTPRIDKLKVEILLLPTPGIPIIKKKKWSVDGEKTIGWIMEFVKKYLKLEANEKLFLFVNQSFAPSPDHIVRNLYECFGTDGSLILHYGKSQAWG